MATPNKPQDHEPEVKLVIRLVDGTAAQRSAWARLWQLLLGGQPAGDVPEDPQPQAPDTRPPIAR
jgi:hypothetical protein